MTATERGAVVRVTEETRLYFVRSEHGDIDSTAYKIDHELSLVTLSGRWLLDSSTCLTANRYSLPITQLAEDPVVLAGEAAGVENSSSLSSVGSSSVMPAGVGAANGAGSNGDAAPSATPASLSREQAVGYAVNYWNQRSSLFADYGDNDCTNFVSQCLFQGGWSTVGTVLDRSNSRSWFYGLLPRLCSYSWGGADNWATFAYNYSGRVRPISGGANNMSAGDVLQFDFQRNGVIDHTQICTGVKILTGEPLMTQHSNDYVNRPLSEILAGNPDAGLLPWKV
jgi:hypothetical protein